MENRNGGTHASKLEKNIDVCTFAYSKGTKYLVGPLVANGLDTYLICREYYSEKLRSYTVKRYLIIP